MGNLLACLLRSSNSCRQGRKWTRNGAHLFFVDFFVFPSSSSSDFLPPSSSSFSFCTCTQASCVNYHELQVLNGMLLIHMNILHLSNTLMREKKRPRARYCESLGGTPGDQERGGMGRWKCVNVSRNAKSKYSSRLPRNTKQKIITAMTSNQSMLT